MDDTYFGSFLEANHTNFRRRPSLPKEVWQKLTRADQLVWDQLSDDGKWNIISDLNAFSTTKELPPSSSQANSNQSTPSIQPTSTTRRVQMINHEGDLNAQGIEVQYTDTHSPTSHQL